MAASLTDRAQESDAPTDVQTEVPTDVRADQSVLVRSLRTAVRVPGARAPYDTVAVTVRYPALPATDDVARMSGVLAPDLADAPFPVVVLLSGINVSSAGYLDLGIALVRAGFVSVTYDWVGELFPGQYGLTPGIDLAAVTPASYGSAPTTPALAPVLEALDQVQANGPLAGALDLTRVGLFGHSAGGTVALQSAAPAWFPQVRSVATYGAHTMASEQLGFGPDTLLASPARVPVLLVEGAEDGVVAASAIRYGRDPHDPSHSPVLRTFTDALAPDVESSWALLAGAGHMLPVAPEDPTSARGFLETAVPDPAETARLRGVLNDLLVRFYRATLLGDPEARSRFEADLPRTPPAPTDSSSRPHPDIVDSRRR